jgi:hypothetical protein
MKPPFWENLGERVLLAVFLVLIVVAIALHLHIR